MAIALVILKRSERGQKAIISIASRQMGSCRHGVLCGPLIK